MLTLQALAQDSVTTASDRPISNRRLMNQASAHRWNGVTKASDLLGATVKNYQDEKLGKVEDVAVDVETGRIIQVIVSTGGFIGIGDTLSAVPPGSLHYDSVKHVVHLDANKEKLTAAPKFDMSQWSDHNAIGQLNIVYAYYGDEPSLSYLNAESKERLIQDTSVAAVDSRPRPLASRLAQIQKASKLMGIPVTNLQDEKLGKLDNILLDLASGRLVAVIVSTGGFLGIGDELSAVPGVKFRFTEARDGLVLDTTKEQLGAAPHFKSDQWPSFEQPAYAVDVYRAHHVEPYFGTNVVTQADNTARNTRDRANRTLTPLDQGNNREDLNTTAQIRKGIIAGENMSVNAKNVKIITNQGQVTLRGPVNTDEEKRLIGDIANSIARTENVDNQLEVK